MALVSVWIYANFQLVSSLSCVEFIIYTLSYSLLILASRRTSLKPVNFHTNGTSLACNSTFEPSSVSAALHSLLCPSTTAVRAEFANDHSLFWESIWALRVEFTDNNSSFCASTFERTAKLAAVHTLFWIFNFALRAVLTFLLLCFNLCVKRRIGRFQSFHLLLKRIKLLCRGLKCWTGKGQMKSRRGLEIVINFFSLNLMINVRE